MRDAFSTVISLFVFLACVAGIVYSFRKDWRPRLRERLAVFFGLAVLFFVIYLLTPDWYPDVVYVLGLMAALGLVAHLAGEAGMAVLGWWRHRQATRRDRFEHHESDAFPDEQSEESITEETECAESAYQAADSDSSIPDDASADPDEETPALDESQSKNEDNGQDESDNASDEDDADKSDDKKEGGQ